MADEEEVEGGPAAEPVPEGPFASPELLEACMLGKLGRLKAFLDKNPDDLKLVSEKRGWSPLQVAVGFSKMEIVQELIERKADIVTPDKMGMTVLHTAADCDTADIVQVILDTEEGKGLIDAVDAVSVATPCAPRLPSSWGASQSIRVPVRSAHHRLGRPSSLALSRSCAGRLHSASLRGLQRPPRQLHHAA